MELEVFERAFREPVRFGPHTLDSPVRYEVWRDYALNPGTSLDLLLEPTVEADPKRLGRALLQGLEVAKVAVADAHPAVADDVVLVRVRLETLLAVVLRLTAWGSLVDTVQALPASNIAEHIRAALAGEPPARDTSADHRRGALDDLERLRWFLLLVARIALQSKAGALPDLSNPDVRIRAARWLLGRARLPFRSEDHPIKSISLNRVAETSVIRSRGTVKADAALRLFEIDASEIGWAVVDSGIEARHPAFRRRDPTSSANDPYELPFERGPEGWVNHTRVAETYDFVQARDWLGVSSVADMAEFDVGQRIERHGRITHDDQYVEPSHVHGTHVAGILGADWPDAIEPIYGVCPGITLYDFRVLAHDGRGDEFSIVTALNHIRRVNNDAGRLRIMGVNLSLSLSHDVANYACGWTPVCRACDILVDSGVVVVVAAGNTGFRGGPGARLADGTNYLPISITDPGNADKVITVGSTHREFPYRYGVSYFSARGPTADGRRKPDLLAPGEGIVGPVGMDDRITLDGTSQAAPHVSAAAALLLARYGELIGQPGRVKQILCESASDLGRDRAFQGHGLLDVLRALQAI